MGIVKMQSFVSISLSVIIKSSSSSKKLHHIQLSDPNNFFRLFFLLKNLWHFKASRLSECDFYFFFFFAISFDCTITTTTTSMNANGFHLIWFLHISFRYKKNSTSTFFPIFCLLNCKDFFFMIKLRLFYQIVQILNHRENFMKWFFECGQVHWIRFNSVFINASHWDF